MGFFSSGITLSKLSVLFFLRTLDLPLTAQQMTDLDAREGWMGYFNLRQALADLVESGLLRTIPSVLGESFVLTESGKDVIEQFEKRIPDSQRAEMERFARDNRQALLIERQYSTTMKKEAPMEYRVMLKAFENEKTILELSFMVTSRSAAKRVCEQWSDKAPGVYKTIVMQLQSGEDEPDPPGQE